MPERIDKAIATDILIRLVDGGVDLFHSSAEYESFAFFADLMRGLRGLRPNRRLALIGKIGVPDFGESRFNAAKFELKVDRYLQAFDIETVDVVEWLVRVDLRREGRRLAVLAADGDAIGSTFERLRAKGKVGSVVSFPYTIGFGERVLDAPWCDGLALYINPLERELASLLDVALSKGKSVFGIRPFAANRAVKPNLRIDGTDSTGLQRMSEAWPNRKPAGQAIRYALAHPAVATAVVSINSIEQAASALAEASTARVDLERFRKVTWG